MSRGAARGDGDRARLPTLAALCGRPRDANRRFLWSRQRHRMLHAGATLAKQTEGLRPALEGLSFASLTGFPVRSNGPFPRPGRPFTAGRAQRRSRLAVGHRRRRRGGRQPGAASTAASTARHWRSRGTRSACHHRVRHAVRAALAAVCNTASDGDGVASWAVCRRSSRRHESGRSLRHPGVRGLFALRLRHWFAVGSPVSRALMSGLLFAAAPLAIMGVRLHARHHSVGRARGTRLLSVSPGLP
jgi:hypothetical protein